MNTIVTELLPVDGTWVKYNRLGDPTSCGRIRDLWPQQLRTRLVRDHDIDDVVGELRYIERSRAGAVWGVFETSLDELDEGGMYASMHAHLRRAAGSTLDSHYGVLAHVSLVAHPALLVRPARLTRQGLDVRPGWPHGWTNYEAALLDRGFRAQRTRPVLDLVDEPESESELLARRVRERRDGEHGRAHIWSGGGRVTAVDGRPLVRRS